MEWGQEEMWYVWGGDVGWRGKGLGAGCGGGVGVAGG